MFDLGHMRKGLRNSPFRRQEESYDSFKTERNKRIGEIARR